jgi:hypothetical protein
VEEHGPVLDIRTYRLLPGTRDEFDRIFREHARPLLERHGIDVVAAGPSLLGDDLYTLVRSFDSLEQRREQLEEFYGSGRVARELRRGGDGADRDVPRRRRPAPAGLSRLRRSRRAVGERSHAL